MATRCHAPQRRLLGWLRLTIMQRTIFAVLFLLAVCFTALGQVQLTNLDQKSFKIDVTGPPTNVVNLFLRSTQFSPSTTGWVLTNISGVYGGSTNIITNSIWGIDGFGNITPVVTNNAVIATNIVRYGVGRMFGTESWLSKALTLTNGPNYIGAAENSQFFLIGPTTNPADCQIILSNAVATGQKLVLVNQTNAIPAEGAWTMTNNTPIPDGAGVVKLLGGFDLVSTNGYISYFEFISPDWQEVGRILSSGASGLLTNVFNNIVVYSNITLKGNSTLTINNITLTTNDLWHTNLVGGAATLQPVNLGLQPLVGKGWLSGTNTPGSGLLPLALPFNVLSSVRSEDIGDPAASYMYIAQARNNNNPKSFLSFVASTNALSFQLGANDGTDQSTLNFVTANGSDMQFTLQKNLTNFTLLYPTRGATLTPYVFDTDKTHTTNNMMDFRNGSSLTAQWESSGQWDFGLDTVNFTPTVFGLGKLTQFAYISNSIPDNSLDTLGGIRLRTSFTATPSTPAWSSPMSWIGTGWSTNNAGAEEVRFSAYVAPTSGSSHPSGTFFIQGSSNELSPHTVFGLSLYSGYTGTGTNVFLDNGTFGAVPGGGGGGGSTLWYSYTGSGSTNCFATTNTIANFSGTHTNMMLIGDGADPSHAGSPNDQIIIGPNTTLTVPYIDMDDPLFHNNPDNTDTVGQFSVISDTDGGLAIQGIGDNTSPSLLLVGKANSTNDFLEPQILFVATEEPPGAGDALAGRTLFGFVNDQTQDRGGPGQGRYGVQMFESHGGNDTGFPDSVVFLGINTHLPISPLHVINPPTLLNDTPKTNVVATIEGRADQIADLTQWKLTGGTVLSSIPKSGGFASFATENGAITSTGWTNSLGKDADVAFDGTTIIYKLADNAGSWWYTNTTAVGQGFIHLQPGGKFVLVSGSGLTGQYHAY